jgi:bifunctional lysine-specific demethylase and histidyl-hydroxylase NO66
MMRPLRAKAEGMSRAAQKRAKKKKKHSEEKHHNDDQDEGPLQKKTKTPEDDASMKQKENKEKKNHKPKKRIEPTNKELDCYNDGEKRDKDTVDENNDEINEIIRNLISKLTPSQILLLEKVNDGEAIKEMNGEMIDLRDLLQEVTSKQRASCLLQSILDIPLDEFYQEYWERQPLLVQPNDPARFNGFLSLASMKELVSNYPLAYGRDLNVTQYVDTLGEGVKRRVTLDQLSTKDVVIADSKDIWANFDNGNTIRILCPHQYNDKVHCLLSTLELELGCMIGSNAYLTPSGEAQGFAPHYDDIDAFVLQLEGVKNWKVYAPLNKAETLPRVSSSDYTENQLKDIVPVLDVLLKPGDVLYMPRGWIHQAITTPTNQHSLHLTVSAMQKWAWVDYLDILLPAALEAVAASATSTSLREGLPRNFLEYMGTVHEESELPEGLKQAMTTSDSEEPFTRETMTNNALRVAFTDETKKRIMRVTKEALHMIDAACDQIGKRFLSDRLPPAFFDAEKSLTSEHRLENGGKIWPNTMVRLARPGIARLAVEDGKAVLYHCVDNARVYRGNPLSPLEFELDDAPALELLVTTVEPRWIQVQDLIHDDIEDKMELAQSLYDEGILAILQTDKPDKSVQTGMKK